MEEVRPEMLKKQLTKIGLLIIGDEILLGRRADKHFKWALEYFSARGADLSWVYYVGDDDRLLVEQFRTIRARQEICISFGGIGATPDDRTRQAVAEAYGVPLVRNPEALRLIEDQFGDDAYPNRILMAELPEGASLIPNGYNNIPGFFMDEIYCVPGFPEMAWSMVDWVVSSRYEPVAPGQTRFAAVTVPDVRESELIQLLGDAQHRYADVRISSLPRFPQDGQWLVELGFRGPGDRVEVALGYVSQALKCCGVTVNRVKD